jgi:hypothetical protein
MASTRILFPDFRDEQSDSRYPFADSATLIAEDGVNEILRDTFIDASFYVIDRIGRLYVSAIIVAPQKITIQIGDEKTTVVAETSFSPNPAQTPIDGVLSLTDSYGRPAGMLLATNDRLALFAGWDVGTYTFAIEATEFVAAVCIPAQEAGVRGIIAPDGSLVTGDLWLIGDGGVVIRYVGQQNGYEIIRVDVVGVPLFKRFLCIPFDRFEPKNFLKTINDCPPDEYGNFTITATGFEVEDTVLRVTHKDGIIFIDAVGRKVV